MKKQAAEMKCKSLHFGSLFYALRFYPALQSPAIWKVFIGRIFIFLTRTPCQFSFKKHYETKTTLPSHLLFADFYGFCPGKRFAFPVRNHFNCTGTNGSGKKIDFYRTSTQNRKRFLPHFKFFRRLWLQFYNSGQR